MKTVQQLVINGENTNFLFVQEASIELIAEWLTDNLDVLGLNELFSCTVDISECNSFIVVSGDEDYKEVYVNVVYLRGYRGV